MAQVETTPTPPARRPGGTLPIAPERSKETASALIGIYGPEELERLREEWPT